MMSLASKSAVPSMLISFKETGKNQMEQSQESMGDAPVLSHCSLLKHPWTNRPVSYSIVVKEKPTLVSHISVLFLLTASLRRRRMSIYISLFEGCQYTFLYSKDVNIHFFIRSSKSSKLHQPSEGTFEVTINYINVWKKCM